MQDLVAEYQQYQDATFVLLVRFLITCADDGSSVEEEGEYEGEPPVEEE